MASPLDVPGGLALLSTVDEIRRLPGVCDVELFLRPGDVVQPFTQSAHKLGYLVVTGDTPPQAEQRLAHALDVLGLTVIPAGDVAPAEQPEGKLDVVN
jgi:hypothetical protein